MQDVIELRLSPERAIEGTWIWEPPVEPGEPLEWRGVDWTPTGSSHVRGSVRAHIYVPSRELARWESEQASQTCQKQPAPWWEPRPGDVSWRIVTSGDPDPETAARLFIAERGCHWASGTIVLDEGVRPTISTRDGQAVIALWAPAGQLRRLDRGDIDAITEVCGTSDWHLIDEHGRIVTTGRAR